MLLALCDQNYGVSSYLNGFRSKLPIYLSSSVGAVVLCHTNRDCLDKSVRTGCHIIPSYKNVGFKRVIFTSDFLGVDCR